MKIILTQDVPRVGVKGSIHDLAQAYAMNSFINKGLARLATPQDEKRLKEKEEKRKEEKEKSADKFIEVFLKLEKESKLNPLEIKKKTDDKGHFYAKFSNHDVVDVIFSKAKISINESQIITKVHDITTLGEHEVELSVNNKKYKILVKIVK